jgi:hypothetical protein
MYIPLFMLLTIVFLCLIVFQYLAYASSTSLIENPEKSLFSKLQKPWVLIALLVVETIWGLSFLRDACTFMVYHSRLLRIRLCHPMVLPVKCILLRTSQKTDLQELRQRGGRVIFKRLPVHSWTDRESFLR